MDHYNLQMKKLLKIFLSIIIILSLFGLSELLYQINHSTDIKLVYSYKLSRFAAQKGNAQISVDLLTNAANILINYNKTIYEEQIPENYVIKMKLKNNVSLKNDINRYISSLNYEYLTSQNRYIDSRVYYELALIALKNSDEDLASRLLLYSFYLGPNTSYWAVELANYHYYKGRSFDALEVLGKCIKLQSPMKHCQDYYDYINSNGGANTPGFLLSTTEKYYNSASLLKKLSIL